MTEDKFMHVERMTNSSGKPATYEQGYQDGESSANADWIGALSETFENMDDLTGPLDFVERLKARGILPAG